MSTSLSAHNGCIGMFRTSENALRRLNFVTKAQENAKQGSPGYRRDNKPRLSVEAKNEDFKSLATYLMTPAKKIPKAHTLKSLSVSCNTHKNNSVPMSLSRYITKSIPCQVNSENALVSRDWVMLDLMKEDEWDFIHVMKEKPPTYADIVGSGRCLHEHEEENVPLTRHQLPKLKPSKAAKHIHESRDYDLASDDDMW
eukprot:CAMPEP_0195530982 /NCGR_PEP_ID=MMETSP0794_2-20130614/34102_1 /TAXON_ID=515487 /ORGANISM="Stephanopyxis turris, Strain CCMP 815" /LENGTH=197 /DNA_ID=CAMNT_0040662611 /DNA_START=78 /DNA_END=668 /DNA_ORIENTATION=+